VEHAVEVGIEALRPGVKVALVEPVGQQGRAGPGSKHSTVASCGSSDGRW
jgi:hypothetical protein